MKYSLKDPLTPEVATEKPKHLNPMYALPSQN